MFNKIIMYLLKFNKYTYVYILNITFIYIFLTYLYNFYIIVV